MRLLLLTILAAACSDPAASPGDAQSFSFGPYAVAAGQEINNQCVSVTLHNDAPIYVNSVELTTGPGFHHSNWFWVPDYLHVGEDGTWKCADRGYDEAIAGTEGGVLFAQSTQSPHEVQKFPDGVAIVIPPHARILAGTHLLNNGDEALNVDLKLTITPIAEPTTRLQAMGFTNESIVIPPMRDSRFTMECDIGGTHQATLGRPIDFSVYYALAHYHALGTGLTVEAVRGDGTSNTMFETTTRIGDALGGTIDPGFSFEGYDKLRFSCHYNNPRTTAVRWGVGDQEMCTFLSFTDSEKIWGGGVIDYNTQPLSVVDHTDYIEYMYPCSIIASEPNL